MAEVQVDEIQTIVGGKEQPSGFLSSSTSGPDFDR